MEPPGHHEMRKYWIGGSALDTGGDIHRTRTEPRQMRSIFGLGHLPGARGCSGTRPARRMWYAGDVGVSCRDMPMITGRLNSELAISTWRAKYSVWCCRTSSSRGRSAMLHDAIQRAVFIVSFPPQGCKNVISPTSSVLHLSFKLEGASRMASVHLFSST